MGPEEDVRSSVFLAKPSVAPSSSFASATPFPPSFPADKKSVFLFDWWLIKAESGVEGKRLAVGGFTTRQHATRLFSSAPIIKRNDAYTLETADGVTVVVQGMINKERTQDNGFPLEVCNHFLIGFPYNWDHYADEYSNKRSTSTSPGKLSSLDEAFKDSTNRTASTFPVLLDEFPICRVLNFLTSGGDNLTTNVSDHLKNLSMSAAESEMQKSSSYLMEGLGKHNMDNNDGNIVGSASSVEHHAEVLTCSKEEEYSRKNLNEGGGYRITVSKQELVDMRKKAASNNSRKMETCSNLFSFISVNNNSTNHLQVSVDQKLDAEGRNNPVEEGRSSISNSPLLQDVSHLDYSEKLGDDTAGRLCHSDKSIINDTDGLPIPTNLDNKDAYSPHVKIDVKLKISDVIGTLKAGTWQEGSVGTRYVEGELNGFDHSKISKHCSTSNEGESSSDEINGMCLNTLEKIKNCNIPSVENPTTQMCSTVDIGLTGDSEMDMCCQKEPLVKVIEEKEIKKDSIQKQNQDCTECIGEKDFVHFSASAEMMPLAEDKLTGKTTSTGTEEQSSAVKGHNYPYVSGTCKRGGVTLGIPASVSRSEGLKGKSVFSSKMKVKRVSKNYEVASTKLETGETKPNHLNSEEKGFKHTSEYHASVKGDNKDASTGSPAQDPTDVSQICTFDSFKQEVGADPLKCRLQSSLLSSHAATKELEKQNGLAVDHIAMENNSHSNGSPRYSTKYAVQSDIPVMNYSSEDKSLEMIYKTLIDKMNNQDVPKVSVAEESNKIKGSHTSRRRKMLRQVSYVHQSPLTRDRAKKSFVALSESLNFRRSRSGRLIVPPLDNGCQQIIYDADGSITGIMSARNVLNSPSQDWKYWILFHLGNSIGVHSISICCVACETILQLS
ncbi:uncharacterized protein LOC135585704 isoform X1 [Musa acuminata AAA Group]|uniref:uncharacterized protein LOC135585704 isoform X1 n=1 Tax=Musa acuminata AAA Group TaxID=214697 RepID=UPI0031CE6B96